MGIELAPLVAGSRRVFCCHRARLSGRWPDNSLAAVEECVAAGVPRLEVDVRFLRDDSMLVFHDERLDEETDAHGRAEDLEGARARAVRYRGGGPPLAFLEEAVELLTGSGTLLQVDLKGRLPLSEARVAALARALAPLGAGVLVGTQAHWNLRPLAALGLPVAFDPTLHWHAFPWRRAGDGRDPARLGLHGLWDDAPIAHLPGVTADGYLRARVADLVALVPAIEWMVDVATLLHIAGLGLALGALLAQRGIALAAWTLRDEGAEVTGALLQQLFAAGVTTVIGNDAPALARYAARL